MPLDVVDTLCDLVQTPSVNPMGQPFSGDEYLEHAMTDRLEALFQQMDIPFERQQLEPRRANIVARLDGSEDPLDGGKLIVFEVHQDTVPVEGMTIPPWTPEIRDDRVFGRGACDIKGGMACMLAALSRLAEERPAPMPTVVMACSVNEEHGFSGATDMARFWAEGHSQLMPRVPDAVIVAEPTMLSVVVAHKGVVRWKCHTKGKAAHSSTPHLGDSTIYRMSRVLQAIEEYAKNVVPTLGQHPLVGHPTLSVGIIAGGISVNTVPDHCTIEIDRRVLPGEDALAARQHVVDYVNEQLSNDSQIHHDDPFICANGLNDSGNEEVANRLATVAQQKGGSATHIGVPFGTDAPAFEAIGAPTVVFGPGSIDQCHTCDEWVAIEQLRNATEAYYEFAKQAAQ